MRVLVADDHGPTREEVCATLEQTPGFTVCARVADAPGAVEAAVRERPDICLLDVRMPGSGLAAAWEIAARLPETKIVMLTVSEDETDLHAALHAGVAGYLVKDMDMQRLPQTLRGAMHGEAAMQRTLVTRVLESFRGSDPRRRRLAGGGALGERLTTREWQVLELLAGGRTTDQVARQLSLSTSAVRVHVAGVVRKLGVADRAAAIELFRNRADS